MSRLLFLAASPSGWFPLNIGREHAAITAALEGSVFGSQLERLVPELQVGVDRLAHSIARHRPDVVHFSGHSSAGSDGVDGVVLAFDHDDPQRLEGSLLAGLFEEGRDYVKLVVLNACNSAALAERIADAVGCAIGMDGSIHDSDAAHFSESLYRALGDGRSVQVAFELAKAALRKESCQPRLFDPTGRSKGLLLVSRELDPTRSVGNRNQVVRSPGRSARSVWLGAFVVVAPLALGGSWALLVRDPPHDEASAMVGPEPTQRDETELAAPQRAPHELSVTQPTASDVALANPPSKRSVASPPGLSPDPLFALPVAGEAVPVPQAPSGAGNPSLSVVAERFGRSIAIDDVHPFRLGDRYGFYLQVDEPSYVLVLQLTEATELERLYPPQGDLLLTPGVQHRVPPRAQGDFEITSGAQSERLVLLLAGAPTSMLRTRELSQWLRNRADWPADWTIAGLRHTATVTDSVEVRRWTLRGSSFVPRQERPPEWNQLSVVHFLEIDQAR